MFRHFVKITLYLLCVSCITSQNSDIIGGSCEGCQAIYESQDRELSSTDTLPDFELSTQKIKMSGIVYQLDGKTPAPEVILYIYQTNAEGKYPKRDDSSGWEARHGYIRTWIKTDSNGRYEFYTGRPASYPNSSVPQHIHVVVKEPDKMEYYVEDFFFADDPNLTSKIKNRQRPRGGSGVVTLTDKDGIKVGNRDIILGLHVPNY